MHCFLMYIRPGLISFIYLGFMENGDTSDNIVYKHSSNIFLTDSSA